MLGSSDDWEQKLKRAEEEITTSRQRRQELQQAMAALGRLGRQIASTPARPPCPEPGGPEGAGETEAGPRAHPPEPGAEPVGAGAEDQPEPVPAEPGDGRGPDRRESPPTGPGRGGAAGETPPPPGAEPGGGGFPEREPGPPDRGRGEDGWRARWRQAILERQPQVQLERGGVLARAVADRMRSLEEAIDTTSRFFADVADKLRAGEAHLPIPAPLVKEVVTSDDFRHLTARLVADILRVPIRGAAHSRAAPILCSEAGHPQTTRKGREVVLMKTQELWWWWILIIVLVFVFCFCFFPLGGAAGQ